MLFFKQMVTPRSMLCLGIESTAHTFSIAVVRKKNQGKSHGKSHEDWEFLSNIRKPFVTDKGGMVPAQVSDHHVAVVAETLDEALKAADVSMKDIQLIAFSQGPGIGTCLRIGAATARSLALRYTIPLIVSTTALRT